MKQRTRFTTRLWGLRKTPPDRLRVITPWWLLRLLNRHLPVCWAGVVMWKSGHEGWKWWPDERCFQTFGIAPKDYCGKWTDEAAADALTPRAVVPK